MWGTIIDGNLSASDCRPLNCWLQAALTWSHAGLCIILTWGKKFTYLDADTYLIHQRWTILVQYIPIINPALSHAQRLLIASKIGNLATEHQTNSQEKPRQASEKMTAAIKSVGYYLEANVMHIFRMWNAADESSLLNMYTALEEATKGQNLKGVYRTVDATDLHYW